MKKLFALLMSATMAFSLCACGGGTQENVSTTPENEVHDVVQDVAQDVTEDKVVNTKGTRKDPYMFGEEIKFTTLKNNEFPIEYTVTVKEFISGYAVGNYSSSLSAIDENSRMIRVEVAIDGEYDEAVDLGVSPVVITKNMDEGPHHLFETLTQTAEERNELVTTGYCGGRYDLQYTWDDVTSEEYAYLKLCIDTLYYVDGESKENGAIWVKMPTEEECKSGKTHYTGRGFEGDSIVGMWISEIDPKQLAAVFYEDGTYYLVFGMNKSFGTWTKTDIEYDVTESEEFKNLNNYIVDLDGGKLAVTVYDNINVGDGVQDSMIMVIGDSATIFERAQ